MKDEGKEIKLRSFQYPNAVTYAKRYSIKHIFRAGAVVWTKYKGKDYYLVFRSFTRPNRGVQLPGGRIERGEDIGQTVVREIREETGLEVKIVCPLGFAYFEDPDRDTSNLQIYYIVRPKKHIKPDARWTFVDKDETMQKLECWFELVSKPPEYLSVGHDKIIEMFRDWLEEHNPKNKAKTTKQKYNRDD